MTQLTPPICTSEEALLKRIEHWTGPYSEELTLYKGIEQREISEGERQQRSNYVGASGACAPGAKIKGVLHKNVKGQG